MRKTNSFLHLSHTSHFMNIWNFYVINTDKVSTGHTLLYEYNIFLYCLLKINHKIEFIRGNVFLTKHHLDEQKSIDISIFCFKTISNATGTKSNYIHEDTFDSFLQLSLSIRSNQWMFEKIIYTLSINQHQILKRNHQTNFGLPLITRNSYQINNRYNPTRARQDRSKE